MEPAKMRSRTTWARRAKWFLIGAIAGVLLTVFVQAASPVGGGDDFPLLLPWMVVTMPTRILAVILKWNAGILFIGGPSQMKMRVLIQLLVVNFFLTGILALCLQKFLAWWKRRQIRVE
ncbi:MAG TPA: hypothetical protein VI454_19310 [Verrucomicrobiae bacterium]|jgi:hypothetical protein